MLCCSYVSLCTSIPVLLQLDDLLVIFGNSRV